MLEMKRWGGEVLLFPLAGQTDHPDPSSLEGLLVLAGQRGLGLFQHPLDPDFHPATRVRGEFMKLVEHLPGKLLVPWS